MATPAPTRAAYVGIDSAARTLAVVVQQPGVAPTPAWSVPNTAAGWQTLLAHLTAAGLTPATTHLVMEATGAYWQGLAAAVTAAGWTASVIAPGSARHDAQARRRRAKTDAVDAAVVAA